MTGYKLSYGGANSMTVAVQPVDPQLGHGFLFERDSAATYEGKIKTAMKAKIWDFTTADPPTAPSSHAAAFHAWKPHRIQIGYLSGYPLLDYSEDLAVIGEGGFVSEISDQLVTMALESALLIKDTKYFQWDAIDLPPEPPAMGALWLWGTRSEGGLSYPGATSPFVLFSKPFEEATSLDSLVTYVRYGGFCEGGQALGDRLEELAEDLEEDAEAIPISLESIAGFIEFLLVAESLRDPGLVVTPNGNICAEWHESWEQHFVIEFVSHSEANFVLFVPDPKQRFKTMRLAGTCSIASVYDEAKLHGIAEWASR